MSRDDIPIIFNKAGGASGINKGVLVTLACAAANFILGAFYAWSVFADGLIRELAWTKAHTSLPFLVHIIGFSLMMVVAGRFQDKIGPRFIVTLGGLFSGVGFILCALFPTPIGMALSFGLLFGTGCAFGYAAVLPAALKWFPPEKKGLITGIVIMGQGLAALVWPFLLTILIQQVGVIKTFAVWGLFLLVSVTLVAQLITIPPGGEVETRGREETLSRSIFLGSAFIILWIMIGLSIGTGHMLTAHLAVIATVNYQIRQGYLFVTFSALFNTIGRLTGGVIVDRLGYLRALGINFLALILSMLLFLQATGWWGVLAATVIFGFGYGGLFTVFPATLVEIFGLDNFGLKYGLLFTGVAVGGALGSYFSGYLADIFNSYNSTFIMGLAAGGAALLLTSLLPKGACRVPVQAEKLSE